MIWCCGMECGNSLPSTMVEGKFQKTLGALPNEARWELSMPTVHVGLEGAVLYGARYGARTEDEHKRCIDTLRRIYKNDRLAFSDVNVIDARESVIGAAVAPHCELPVIRMQELMKGSRYCRDIRENMHDGQVRVAHLSVSNDTLRESTRYAVFLVRDDRMLGDKKQWLQYMRTDGEVFNENNGYDEQVREVHNHHMTWVKNQKTIDRVAFSMQMNTYNMDPTVTDKQREQLKGNLQKKFLRSEMNTYCVNPRSLVGGGGRSFDEKIGDIHNEHGRWIKEKRSLSHVDHRKWVEIYNDDKLLGVDECSELVRLVTQKFLAFIHDLDETHPGPRTKFINDAFGYWVNIIP